ncbi:SAM-dependent methyltransferase [Dysgonomonas sp. PH5-45]|uniref:hypothetical protein n=1 Tax=unclassified Dysgonomonas TaxID=2630389 RepID=UPI0024735051|nr:MULTISPECIES: hypothetical protein [unclassified Dysgonomonas]MDH6354705.1 SAM-dependent methyltransferase [Dysgonomonas sp. PH5-45]MDH6387603.1 SAM-dependent methyltransferase [Dysgonomonas sp. PH5-37]
MIKSIFNSDGEAIKAALDIHSTKGFVDVDPTYSIGNFYRKTGIEEPKLKFDIAPQVEGVIQSDARNLPLDNECVDTIVFDPPFLATMGKSLQKDDASNIIAKRFSVFPNEQELHQFYIDSLKEFYRILRNKGIVIFKCQDKVSSGKQYLSHVFIINEAERLGFYTKDIGILLAKSRIMAQWQKNQKHFRKFHSYYLILQKQNKNIKYV